MPAEFWKKPRLDATYRGFDPNLIYVGAARESWPKQGLVTVSRDLLLLEAVPASQPMVHLVNTPLSFVVDVTVRILGASPSSRGPFRLDVWHPEIYHVFGISLRGSAYRVEFGAPPQNLIMTSVVEGGFGSETLQGGRPVRERILGTYEVGEAYRVSLAVNRRERGERAGVRIVPSELPPGGGPVLRVQGGPPSPVYSDVMSEFVPVEAGKRYRYGGLVYAVPGAKAFKINLQWVDKRRTHIGFAGEWSDASHLINQWQFVDYSATAPQEAAFARLILGASRGSLILFSKLFLEETGRKGVNLLRNGDLEKGSTGWVVHANDPLGPQVVGLRRNVMEDEVGPREAPELFASRRLALTISAYSDVGVTSVLLQDFVLSLPHQRWQGVKVEDGRARMLLWVCLSLSCAVVAYQAVLAIRRLGK
jgi:hypothetical protein